MTRSEVISAVKARLDELAPFQDNKVVLDEQSSVKPVEQYAEEFLDEATDAVRLLAPEHRITPKDIPTTETDPETGETNNLLEEQTLGNSDIRYYRLAAPPDFLKIAEVQMSNWERPCFSTITADGEGYRMLRNVYTTVGYAKPAVVVSGGYLEFYGSRVSGDTLTTGKYIDKRYYGNNDDMEQSGLVDAAIIWRCALLVLGVMGRNDVVKLAEGFYAEALRAMII